MATNQYDDIYSTYANQRYNGLDARTLRRALRPYKKYRITMAGARGKSDARLRQMAVSAVLSKFKASKQGKRAAARGTANLRARRPRSTVAPLPRLEK